VGATIIRRDKLSLKGSPLSGGTQGQSKENPQPFFRQPDLSVAGGRKFPKDKKYSFGRETGFRVLPYTMQDRYKRDLIDMEFPSLVMENDYLRAEIIPSLGGRLWSLFDKQGKRDILYRNSVFRPANLAIRDAWFSGGIEWNIGRLGHAPHTCSPVFAGIFKKGREEAIRLWEFERQTRLFWRVEFTLPENSSSLFAYVRIENPDTEAKPLYWWTNIAVPQTQGVRVFSSTSEVIYIVPSAEGKTKTMDYGRLPRLSVLSGKDSSYPFLSDFSNEYFFQNDRADKKSLPWESAVYEDGYAFGEVSTPPLLYRKMFCWGNGPGGRRWQEFLTKGGGEYLEVQAGLAPTQLHTADISGGETVDWVQAFTAFNADSEGAFQKDYRAAAAHVSHCLSKKINAEALNGVLEKSREHATGKAKILFMGSGWGAVEAALKKRPCPRGLSFPVKSITKEEAPWIKLLRKGVLPQRPVNAGPLSFVTDEAWEVLLDKKSPDANDWLGPYHLGVIAFEKGDYIKAEASWKKSVKRKKNPWAYRNLALAALKNGETEQALDYYRYALNLSETSDQSFAEEYIPLLLDAGKKTEAGMELDKYLLKAGYSKKMYIDSPGFEPQSVKYLSGPLMEAAARIALNRRDEALLERIFLTENAHIREGRNVMTEIWTEWKILRGEADGKPLVPPREIDFRMYDR